MEDNLIKNLIKNSIDDMVEDTIESIESIDIPNECIICKESNVQLFKIKSCNCKTFMCNSCIEKQSKCPTCRNSFSYTKKITKKLICNINKRVMFWSSFIMMGIIRFALFIYTLANTTSGLFNKYNDIQRTFLVVFLVHTFIVAITNLFSICYIVDEDYDYYYIDDYKKKYVLYNKIFLILDSFADIISYFLLIFVIFPSPYYFLLFANFFKIHVAVGFLVILLYQLFQKYCCHFEVTEECFIEKESV